ncbi:metallophosphoesterase [Kitasatospora saccharophila]|uniref:metallophosphoesterase n=1 Tax=Kitasatospora saccharophila TaxID=407973 RepID=UPI0036380DE5
MPPSPAPLYAAADVHGHRAEFLDALRGAALADADGHWCGGRARLWMLGDYVDRGPDGIGVIEDIRRLAAQARDAGGRVGALLGNHEVQLLAAHRFGTAPVPGWDQPGGFHGGWSRFGGQEDDLRRLTPPTSPGSPRCPPSPWSRTTCWSTPTPPSTSNSEPASPPSTPPPPARSPTNARKPGWSSVA